MGAGLVQKFKILELNYKFQVLEQQSEFFKILVLVRSGPESTGSDALIPVYNQLVANLFVGF